MTDDFSLINKKEIDSQGESLSKMLMRARQAKKISLEKVAQSLKVNKKYLAALESGELQKLPDGLYGKNYLREYAYFLKIDVEQILSLYDEEVNVMQSKGNYFFGHKVVKNNKTLTMSKAAKGAVLFVVIFVCLGYLSFYLKNISAAPKLELYSPLDNVYMRENNIQVRGRAETDAEVRINGELVLVNRDGVFEKKISLSNGKNMILVMAKKKHGKEAVITRYVVVDNGN